jgi:hypothetical protein
MKSSVLFSFFDFGVRLYTTLQIWLYKIRVNVIQPISIALAPPVQPTGKVPEKNSENTISVIKQGVVFECLPEETTRGADFCVVSRPDFPGTTYNKVVLASTHDMEKYFSTPNIVYRKCDFKFLSVELVISDRRMNLSLFLQDKYNYYMIGNKLNKAFLLYFVKTHAKQEYIDTFKDPEFQYLLSGEFEVNIIDNMCEIISMDGNSALDFFEDMYKIAD